MWHWVRVQWARHDGKDKLVTLAGVVIVVVGLGLAGAAVYFGQDAATTSREAAVAANNHHAETARQNAAIIALLQENKQLSAENHALLVQHSTDLANFEKELATVAGLQQTVVAQLPGDAAALQSGQGGLEASLSTIAADYASIKAMLAALCADQPGDCGIPAAATAGP
jgi:hypothetical protein